MYSFNSSSLNSSSNSSFLNHSNNSYSSSVDSLGNVTLSQNVVQNHTRSSENARPPPSPLWGWGQATQKTVTMNVTYKLESIRVVPTSTGNVVLCTWTPGALGTVDKQKSKPLKVARRRKRRLVDDFNSCKWRQRKLKRLQRHVFLKVKKEEIYEKWKKRKVRREFRQRKRQNCSISDLDMSLFSMSSFLSTTTASTSFREGSESPFNCPVWCCQGTRRSRRDQEKRFRRRKLSSQLSHPSDKSRSPIRIRSSPL